MARHLSPQYCQVILVSGYLVLTAVNWSQHWCAISKFKAIHGLAPKYLCDLLTFKSSLYNLGSSDSILLFMPAARSKTLGDRAFMVAAPRLWNSHPKELRAITNVNSFKAHIKTYLFKTIFCIQFLLACIYILFIFYFLMHYLLFVSFKVMQL